MLETALTRRSASVQTKITLKTLISAGLIALAVVLPQVVHIALGQPGGVQLLPMYLPVLIGGCLLGLRWAPAVGVLSPVVSYLITSLAGSPMPALPRLPFMMAELAPAERCSSAWSRFAKALHRSRSRRSGRRSWQAGRDWRSRQLRCRCSLSRCAPC